MEFNNQYIVLATNNSNYQLPLGPTVQIHKENLSMTNTNHFQFLQRFLPARGGHPRILRHVLILTKLNQLSDPPTDLSTYNRDKCISVG